MKNLKAALFIGALLAMTPQIVLAESSLTQEAARAVSNLNTASEYAGKATVNVLDFVGEKGKQYINGLEKLTSEFAPDVVDATLGMVRIVGLQQILYGIGISILALFLFRVGGKLKARADAMDGRYGATDWRVGASFVYVSSIASGIWAGTFLLNAWSWVALFAPKLYLAKTVFDIGVQKLL